MLNCFRYTQSTKAFVLQVETFATKDHNMLEASERAIRAHDQGVCRKSRCRHQGVIAEIETELETIWFGSWKIYNRVKIATNQFRRRFLEDVAESATDLFQNIERLATRVHSVLKLKDCAYESLGLVFRIRASTPGVRRGDRDWARMWSLAEIVGADDSCVPFSFLLLLAVVLWSKRLVFFLYSYMPFTLSPSQLLRPIHLSIDCWSRSSELSRICGSLANAASSELWNGLLLSSTVNCLG